MRYTITPPMCVSSTTVNLISWYNVKQEEFPPILLISFFSSVRFFSFNKRRTKGKKKRKVFFFIFYSRILFTSFILFYLFFLHFWRKTQLTRKLFSKFKYLNFICVHVLFCEITWKQKKEKKSCVSCKL
jgi:hypothetical protein